MASFNSEHLDLLVPTEDIGVEEDPQEGEELADTS